MKSLQDLACLEVWPEGFVSLQRVVQDRRRVAVAHDGKQLPPVAAEKDGDAAEGLLGVAQLQ